MIELIEGKIVYGSELGYKTPHHYICVKCPKCDKLRYENIYFYKKQKIKGLCNHCRGNTRPGWLWKNGIYRRKDGYIYKKLFKDDLFINMARRSDGYILEHRLIMAKYLGRCLSLNEQVHHKNGIRDDNRIENLELISKANHSLINRLCGNCELRKEIRLLRFQIKEMYEILKNHNLNQLDSGVDWSIPYTDSNNKRRF
jgi:hypothetical protein